MKFFKCRIQEFETSGLTTTVQLPSLSTSLFLVLFLFLLQSLVVVGVVVEQEELEKSTTDQGSPPQPATTPLPCIEVTADALWMRLDFHNNRYIDIEKHLSDTGDPVITSGKSDKSTRRQKKKNSKQSNFKNSNNTDNNSSSESRQQQPKHNRSSRLNRNSTKSSLRRHHNKNKKSSINITSTMVTASSIISSRHTLTQAHKKFKQPDKRKRSNGVRKRNIDTIEEYSPWLCQMTPYWDSTGEDTVPNYVKTGNCTSNASCHQGSYECGPKTYIIKVLKRLKNVCYPVPTTDSNRGFFEEAWISEDREVTVACECTRPRSPGVYIKKSSG